MVEGEYVRKDIWTAGMHTNVFLLSAEMSPNLLYVNGDTDLVLGV